ncbi:MAG: hypothetical protein ACHQTE_00885 [Candidatus Saccharimonadales bacterium]
MNKETHVSRLSPHTVRRIGLTITLITLFFIAYTVVVFAIAAPKSVAAAPEQSSSNRPQYIARVSPDTVTQNQVAPAPQSTIAAPASSPTTATNPAAATPQPSTNQSMVVATHLNVPSPVVTPKASPHASADPTPTPPSDGKALGLRLPLGG